MIVAERLKLDDIVQIGSHEGRDQVEIIESVGARVRREDVEKIDHLQRELPIDTFSGSRRSRFRGACV